MAEGGSSPLGDPGGLHVYSMNGGTHKLTELVADGSSVDMMGSVPVCQMSFQGSPEPSPYTNSMQSSFTYPGTLGFDSGSFEDMKRSTHLQPSYYTPMESPSYLNAHSNIFDMSSQGFSSVPDMYKTSNETVSYTEMVPKANSISPAMNIKKEKIDYTDHIGMIASHSSDIPYPPNTCIADWNYFNSNNTVTNIEQPHYSQYSQPMLHSSQQYNRGQYYNTNQEPHIPMPLSLTNEDIHQQSKKITQSIISSEWNNETLYKSTMYSSLNEEGVINKKRRAIVDRKGKDSKSRKKKPGELGGHSKAVASILLSDNNMTDKNNTHRNNENILDSGERNSFVTTLMNNLRSTVQFESFCLSLPRSPTTESAFNTRVRHTSDTISALGSKTILSKPFPPNYIQGAEKVMLSFKKALNNTEKAAADLKIPGKNNIEKERDLSCDQVEEHIPHSMVWVLRVGEKTLNATWEGQFVATVNPVQNTLCCSIFQFSPTFSAEGIKCLHQCLLSKLLAQDILINMEQFEVSRQLRFDIKLKNVAQMYLYTEPGNVSEGCLLLEVSEQLDYFQRWLHTSAEDKNRWRKRFSFFQQDPSDRTTGIVYIGGLISELNELVALMLACNPELKAVYDVGVTNPFLASLWNTENGQVVENGQSGFDCVSGNTSSPGPRTHMKDEVRKQILKILAKHDIRVNISEGNNHEFRVDESLSNCFRDYVNFACESATELDEMMNQKVSPWLYGFYESDFNMAAVPNADLEQLTVAQLISNKCSEIVYFSFCRKEVGQLGHDTHCPLCRKCFTFRYQHCYSCNRCSEVKTVCEFCGRLRDDLSRVIIKPLSVFKAELQKGAIVIDSLSEAWRTALQQPDNDVLCLKPQCVYQQSEDRTQTIEYNSNNAMVDQLGLLNPVGFLLGQGAVGATRKHRRYKGMQPSLNSLDRTPMKGGNSVGGCILQ